MWAQMKGCGGEKPRKPQSDGVFSGGCVEQVSRADKERGPGWLRVFDCVDQFVLPIDLCSCDPGLSLCDVVSSHHC